MHFSVIGFLHYINENPSIRFTTDEIERYKKDYEHTPAYYIAKEIEPGSWALTLTEAGKGMVFWNPIGQSATPYR